MKIPALAFALSLPLALTLAPAASSAPTTDTTLAPKGDYVLDAAHTRIVFGVSHFGLSTYWGQFTSAEASLYFNGTEPEKSRVSTTVDTTSISTGDTKFDTLLQGADWLNAATYPTIIFESTRVGRTGDATGKITGNLTLLGVTKEVTLDVTFNGGMAHPFANVYALGFSGTTTIRRSDFGLTAYIDLGIGDEIQLMIEVEFLEEK